MKKIVVLFVCVLMFSYIYAEELPFDVNEGIEKTKNELAFYLNDGSLSDYFEKSTDVDDIQFSHFGKVQYLNTEMLVRENEIQLKGLPFDNYLFALTVKNEGKVLVRLSNEHGEFLPVDIGGYATGFIQAESIMRELNEEYQIELISPYFANYLMVCESDGTQYVIPFDQKPEGISKEYYNVKSLTELPTLEEYCRILRDEIIRQSEDINKTREEFGIQDILYSGELVVKVLPANSHGDHYSLLVVIGLITVATVAMSIIHKRKA